MCVLNRNNLLFTGNIDVWMHSMEDLIVYKIKNQQKTSPVGFSFWSAHE